MICKLAWKIPLSPKAMETPQLPAYSDILDDNCVHAFLTQPLNFDLRAEAGKVMPSSVVLREESIIARYASEVSFGFMGDVWDDWMEKKSVVVSRFRRSA